MEPTPTPSDFDEGVKEIERKFLVTHLPADLRRRRGTDITQGYLAWGKDGNEVRIRRIGARHFLTVKSAGKLARNETELPISARQFAALWPSTQGARLAKRRSSVMLGDLTVEVDVYQGRLCGLVVAEVEFKSERQAREFSPPSWFGGEVTRNRRYRNSALATARHKPQQ